MKRLTLILLIILTGFEAYSQSGPQSDIVKDFKEACDSLSAMMNRRTGVKGRVTLKAVMKRDTIMDFYFTESLGDYPFRIGDAEWFRETLEDEIPDAYKNYAIGEIKSKDVDIEQLEVAALTFLGKPAKSLHRRSSPNNPAQVVRSLDGQKFSKGLSGRTIAVWHSHGRAFSTGSGLWEWQRPGLFQTVEDMFTQGFVLPYLVPMLENAGAYVMLPRERDVQTNEVIADNDPTGGGRGTATYKETGKWSDAGRGFADPQPTYTRSEEPFTMGTARKAKCSEDVSVRWTPDIPERGFYAVYISYKTLAESTRSALYTVEHMGGSSRFVVNQRIGGGTWVYLGTFEFDKGAEGSVVLSGKTPEGYRHNPNAVITADAVRFGGGMGNITGQPDDETLDPITSGLPRYAEGATYWLQWAGADKSIWSPSEAESDYSRDYMSRGDWVDWISGGSSMNPGRNGKGIPVDLSFGFHTDAGVYPDKRMVGTLAIYTYKSKRDTLLPNKESRMNSREYADIVQSQIVHDLQGLYTEDWPRRQIWDRSYRESRTPSCPAMLLELLSHQNFEDMKYGLDPTYRFMVCRAIYKGMLKYLSNRYGVPYIVQPLGVEEIGVRFAENGNAVLSWKAVSDTLEPTAAATGFILYTRKGDGSFDNGQVINATETDGKYVYEVSLSPGEIYSYRIAAFNDGGKSFPSETVSIGTPADGDFEKTVLGVNNFDRVSGPAFFELGAYAGFDNRTDSGVPDVRDITFIGEMFEFRRDMPWVSNTCAGFGTSYHDYAGKTVAGNTHDYAYVHGKAVIKAGFSFISCSNEAFCSDTTYRTSAWAIDLICGKQVTTTIGSNLDSPRFQVFPKEMMSELSVAADSCVHILVSGAHIGTDAWDQIYPYTKDDEATLATQNFIKEVLGYKWTVNHASRSGEVSFIQDMNFAAKAPAGSFYTAPNPERYCIENPDGISPASKKGRVIMRYSDTNIPAGIRHDGGGYRTVCLGFPIEALKKQEDIDTIIKKTLEYFNR